MEGDTIGGLGYNPCERLSLIQELMQPFRNSLNHPASTFVVALGLSLLGSTSNGATLTVGAGGSFDHLTLTSAISAAVSGDVISIASGTYGTDQGEQFPINLKTGLTVRATAPGDRPIIQGDGAQRVVNLADLRGVTLEGLTIRSGDTSIGGGLAVSGSTVVVRDCTIEANHAIASAGGIYLTDGSAGLFENCTIRHNSAETFGGGMTIDQGSNFRFIDCQFRENTGGAVQCSGSSPRFIRCNFFANRGRIGGAVACFASNPKFIDCEFVDNAADIGTLGGGGAMFMTSSSPLILGCNIVSNRSTEDAGAVLCDSGSSPRFQNCVIAGNRSVERAGAIGCSIQSNPLFVNCIIVGNQGQAGGMLFTSSSGPEFLNCVIRDNDAVIGPWISTEDPDLGGTESTVDVVNSIVRNGVSSVSNLDNSVITVLQSHIEDPIPGAGNVGTDPGFVASIAGTWTAAPVFDPVARTTLLIDSAASFGAASSLSGRKATVRIGASVFQHFAVFDNTETGLIVWGDATQEASIGTAYELFDYHLATGSACIDTGLDELFGPPSAIGWSYGDADGKSRKADGDGNQVLQVDRGAFEFGSIFPVADLNNDVQVDSLDLFLFQPLWRQTTSPSNQPGDMNGDSQTNANDLLILNRNLDLE